MIIIRESKTIRRKYGLLMIHNCAIALFTSSRRVVIALRYDDVWMHSQILLLKRIHLTRRNGAKFRCCNTRHGTKIDV